MGERIGRGGSEERGDGRNRSLAIFVCPAIFDLVVGLPVGTSTEELWPVKIFEHQQFSIF